MTPDIMTNIEQLKYLGMEEDSFKRITVPVKLQNAILNPQQTQYIANKIESEKISTPLTKCLNNIDIQWHDESFPCLIYDKKPDLAVAVVHDVLMMKLFPPKNSLINTQLLQLPVFEVEYTCSDFHPQTDEKCLIDSINKTQFEFEGELLFELLNKAVRSQRNKIEKPFNNESINEAIELIERENEEVCNILINTRALSLIKDQIDGNNQFRKINIIPFSPSGRVNKNRVYFLGSAIKLGAVAKTSSKANLKEGDLSCLYRLGAVILNRNLISVVQH